MNAALMGRAVQYARVGTLYSYPRRGTTPAFKQLTGFDVEGTNNHFYTSVMAGVMHICEAKTNAGIHSVSYYVIDTKHNTVSRPY